MEIVQKYTVDFHKVLEMFNNLPPTIEPTATGHILEQIQLTEKLIRDGFAYESNGSVYFDVQEYNQRGLNYGELSRRNIDELFANTRDLDGQGEKKNPQDFALWKKASPAHIMRGVRSSTSKAIRGFCATIRTMVRCFGGATLQNEVCTGGVPSTPSILR